MISKIKSSKLSAGLVVVSVLGTISVFAMDTMSASGTMMNSDKMMTATGTMMHVDNMMTATNTMMMSDDMMMKITNKSPKTDVAKLQQFLMDKGFLKLIKGTKLGFFGPATKNALKKYGSSKMMMKNHDDKMMSTTTMMQATTTMMHQ